MFVDDEMLYVEFVYKVVGVVGVIGLWNWLFMIMIW